MKLRDCKINTIVTDMAEDRIGVIVGITNAYPHSGRGVRGALENARPIVQWSCGAKQAIHQCNIKPYKGSL